MAAIDVVVVSYNSRDNLRACVEPLAGLPDVTVFVVDNASSDDSLGSVKDLPVTAIALDRNGGFAVGCNAGWRRGEAPYVLLLNPDARIGAESLQRLAAELSDERVGLVGPKILDAGIELDFTLRHFPRLRSTYARALYLHRLLPSASWVDEVIRDRSLYDHAGPAEWLVGACVLVRRTALEALGGLDEDFFLYCEDKDLCARLWEAGQEVRYVPQATCVHAGGASAPRASLTPVLAASRMRYARKHRSRVAVAGERTGLCLEALLRLLASRGGRAARAGHVRALGVLLAGRRAT